MYILRLSCPIHDADSIAGELWEAGTQGIQEIESGERTVIIAFFQTEESKASLIERFSQYRPVWEAIREANWEEETRRAWAPRLVGERLFLAAPWRADPTPPSRIRILHTPGLACGTGEHPCTQLALRALEECVTPACRVVDVGAGSGLLAIAAIRLGAVSAVGLDVDAAALKVARENFLLNGLEPLLAAGSADCLANGCADITVSNIDAGVLVSLLADLRRITRKDGMLILTGFPESELETVQKAFSASKVTGIDEWRCITARLSSGA